MDIKGKGRYIGGRKIEIDQDLNLSPDTEIFFIIQDIKVDPDVDLGKETKKMRKNILQKGLELGQKIPQEELDTLPKDFSENLDSYLYGSPENK